eukprot:6327966-Prymnesium_polylepis.1
MHSSIDKPVLDSFEFGDWHVAPLRSSRGFDGGGKTGEGGSVGLLFGAGRSSALAKLNSSSSSVETGVGSTDRSVSVGTSAKTTGDGRMKGMASLVFPAVEGPAIIVRLPSS